MVLTRTFGVVVLGEHGLTPNSLASNLSNTLLLHSLSLSLSVSLSFFLVEEDSGRRLNKKEQNSFCFDSTESTFLEG